MALSLASLKSIVFFRDIKVITPLVKTSLTACSFFLLLVGSTILAGGAINIANAQSMGEINGNGDLGSNEIICEPNAIITGPFEIAFSAESDSSGIVTSGEFSIFVPEGNVWIGDITGGTISQASYDLEGTLETRNLICGLGIPQIGDLVELTGDCGDDVGIDYSSSDSQIRGTFTGDVECIVSIDPVTAIENLIMDVRTLDGVNFLTKIVLNSHLRFALLFLNSGHDVIACGTMDSFIKSANAYENRGRLTEIQADDLVQQAQVIKEAIGCGGGSASNVIQANEAAAIPQSSSNQPDIPSAISLPH